MTRKSYYLPYAHTAISLESDDSGFMAGPSRLRVIILRSMHACVYLFTYIHMFTPLVCHDYWVGASQNSASKL